MAGADPTKVGSNPALRSVPDSEQPLTQVVAAGLRDEILSGRLQPGQRIKQDAVAKKYGTSRNPVREALRELASEGLLTLEPDVGARVAALHASELVEVYMMREALEPLVIAQSAPHLTADQLTTMREYLEASEACEARQDWVGYHEYDRLFHDATYGGAELPRMRRVLAGLWNTALQYRRVHAMLPHSMEISNVEHRLILEALDRGAAEDAAQVHQVHVRRTRLAFMSHSELFRDPGPMGKLDSEDRE
jgi:DNA-binding GntR family transcriptional regulator